MTVDRLQDQKPVQTSASPQERVENVQFELQKNILQEQMTGENSKNNIMLQLLASQQPVQQIQQTAQNQIEKGYLDVRI